MRLRKILFGVLAGSFIMHLSCCIYLSVFSDGVLFGSHGLTAWYRVYGIPGPFFNEKLIRVSPHCLIRWKVKDNKWSQWTDFENQDFKSYHQQPWRFGLLKRSVFERFLAKNVARQVYENRSPASLKNAMPANPDLDALHRYMQENFIPEQADSVASMYVQNIYETGTKKTRRDTLFLFKVKLPPRSAHVPR